MYKQNKKRICYAIFAKSATIPARCVIRSEVLYEYLRKIRVKTQKSAVRCAIPPSVMAGQEERPLGADFAGNPVSMATALGRVDAYA